MIYTNKLTANNSSSVIDSGIIGCTGVNSRFYLTNIELSGILVGLFLNANFLSGAISMLVPIDNVFIYILLFITALSLIINGFSVPILKKQALLVLVILIQLFYGKLFVNSVTTDQFTLCFFCVGVPCLLLSLHKFSVEKALRAIVISCCLCAPYHIHLLTTEYTVYNSGMQMGVAYSLLPAIFASLIVICGENTFYRVLSIIALLLSTMVLFKLMTRGAYLCIFAFIVGYVYITTKNNTYKRYFIVISMILVASILLVLVGKYFFSSSWYYRIFGIKAHNILNGRERDLSAVFTWRSMKDFLLGSGIGSFKKYDYTDYIHNLLGQIYYEQGIYSVIFVTFIVLKIVHIFIIDNNDFGVIFFLMLFCMGIIRLMVSYYFWIDQSFWLLIWLTLGNQYKSLLVYAEKS